MREHRTEYKLNRNEAYTMKNIILDRINYVSFCFYLATFFIAKNAYAEAKIITPDIQLVNITIEKVTFSSMDVHVGLNIYNPNEFALTVSSLAYSLKVNDVLILSDEIQRKEHFYSKKPRQITIPASLPYNENFGNVLKLLSLNANINYSVFGKIQLDGQEKPLAFSHNDIINPSTYIKNTSL